MTAATLTRLARERMLPREDVAQAVHTIMRKATSIDLVNDYMHCAYLLKWLVMAYPPNLFPQVLHCFDCVLPRGATTVSDQDIVAWIKKTEPTVSNVCSYFAELGATHQVPKTWNPKEHVNDLLFLFSPTPPPESRSSSSKDNIDPQIALMGSSGASEPKKPMSVTETSKALINSIVVSCQEMESAPNVVADVDLARVFCTGSLGVLEPKEPMAITEEGNSMIASINEWCRKMESVTMSHCKVLWMPLVHEANKVYEDGRTKAHAIFEHSEACVSDVVNNDAVSDDDIEGDTNDDVLDQDEDKKPPSLEESRIPWILRNLPSIDDYIEDSERVARENLFWKGMHATVPTLSLGALDYIANKLIAHVYPVTAANFIQSLRANGITPFALYGCAIRCVDGTTTKHIKSLIDILCADDGPC